MNFFIQKNDTDKLRDQMVEEIVKVCVQEGHSPVDSEEDIRFVLNLTSAGSPQFFRRRSRSIFVFSLISVDPAVENLHSVCYTTLVHTLSNMVLCIVPPSPSSSRENEIYCVTPEGGFFHFPYNPEKIFQTIIPLAGSHFAIDNEFSQDLPAHYWNGTPVVEKIKHYGRILDQLGVLPAPFPLKDILSEENIKHLYALFEMKGLSYGNLSARDTIPELGGTTFWMTARGVNKADLKAVGRDILLIKGFNHQKGEALVSVPPEYDPKARVSVDAVEHELIYRSFPGIGAIVHVHAWIEGVPCTRQNYPCGTRELAEEVVHLLNETDDPDQTAVGLKNHGLTITGHNLDDIFDRIEGNLQIQVPMFT